MRRDGLRTPAVISAPSAPTTPAYTSPTGSASARSTWSRSPRPTTTRCASTSCRGVLHDLAAAGSGSRASSPRWARRTRSAWTTSKASWRCATSWSRSTASTTGRTSTPTRSSAGRGASSTTTTSRRTRSASASGTVRALAGAARRIRHLGLADSVGIDFHKTGFAPYISSPCCVHDGRDFDRLARSDEDMPYLFQSGDHHPGRYTLETTRAGSGVLAALANLRLFGRHGLQALLGHLVAMAEVLREQLEGHAATTVLNRDNFGPVTLFRVYPTAWTRSACRSRSDGSGVPRHAARPQRVQPPHLRAASSRGAAGPRRRDLADGLLPRDRLRRADRGAEVVHPVPVLGGAHVDAVLESIWRRAAPSRPSRYRG